jgi:hypothetical protein
LKKDIRRLIEEIKAFDDRFPDGVYAIPKTTKVKVRALEEYCQKKGFLIDSLDEKEIFQFVERVEGEHEL